MLCHASRKLSVHGWLGILRGFHSSALGLLLLPLLLPAVDAPGGTGFLVGPLLPPLRLGDTLALPGVASASSAENLPSAVSLFASSLYPPPA